MYKPCSHAGGFQFQCSSKPIYLKVIICIDLCVQKEGKLPKKYRAAGSRVFCTREESFRHVMQIPLHVKIHFLVGTGFSKKWIVLPVKGNGLIVFLGG